MKENRVFFEMGTKPLRSAAQTPEGPAVFRLMQLRESRAFFRFTGQQSTGDSKVQVTAQGRYYLETAYPRLF